MAACDVELIARDRTCGKTPAEYFEAACACGHVITGHACRKCADARTPGCLTCWKGAAGHYCPATFRDALKAGA